MADKVGRSEADDRFAKMVEKYQSPLRRYLFHLTAGNSSLADDLSQETFIKAYRGWDAFGGGNPKWWLFKIAYNTFVDHKRAAKEYQQIETLQNPAYAAATHIELLRQTMECLDQAEKDVAILSYIEQFSHSEIAKTLDMPLGSVKTTLRRAKIKLQQHLKDEKNL